MGRARQRHTRRLDQGSVLVVVLLLISVLVVGAVECLRLARLEGASSRIFRRSVQDQALVDSGLAFAKYLLSLDAGKDGGDPADHYGEAWAGFFEQNQYPPPEFESGQVNGSIVDERGKFPVNSLIGEKGNANSVYRGILKRLLLSPPFSLEETEAETIVQSLQDWLDPDDMPAGALGAESSFYRSEGKGYTCPNRKMRTLEEVALIRGVPRRLFVGNGPRPALKTLLSVHNSGGININTASPLLVAAMAGPAVSPETAADFAENVLSYRRDSDHFDFLGEKDWYRNRMAGYNDIQLPGGVVATSSDVFSVMVSAGPGSSGKRLYAVLRRQGEEGASLKTLWRESR